MKLIVESATMGAAVQVGPVKCSVLQARTENGARLILYVAALGIPSGESGELLALQELMFPPGDTIALDARADAAGVLSDTRDVTEQRSARNN